jgi:hypothetical protein
MESGIAQEAPVGRADDCLQIGNVKLPSDFDYSAKWSDELARYSGGGKSTVESCRSIDVLDWHRRFRSPQRFSWAWARDGEQVASINVEMERHSVTLRYRSRSCGQDWTNVEQRVAIAWTPCRFGGERPWFICSVYANDTYCGRQVAKLYDAGRLFACRHCYRLAYASQQESAHRRGLWKAQKIRMRLGGSASMLDNFPDKPKGMHWRTYERFCRVHNAAQARFIPGLMGFVMRLRRRIYRRA